MRGEMPIVQSIRNWNRRRLGKRRDIARAMEAAIATERVQTRLYLQKKREDCVHRNPLLAYGRKFWSQHDEDGIIEELTRRMGIFGNATFLELGVGNGTENNTLALLARGWRGVWLGGEHLAFDLKGQRLRFLNAWIDAGNVVQLTKNELSKINAQSPELISVDLDGNDYYINERLLTAGFRPRVWVAEYNARFGPHLEWIMPYDPEHSWRGTDYHGCSYASLVSLFRKHGYRPVCCNLTGVNAFFVPTSDEGQFLDIPASPELLFQEGDYVVYASSGHALDLRTITSMIV